MALTSRASRAIARSHPAWSGPLESGPLRHHGGSKQSEDQIQKKHGHHHSLPVNLPAAKCPSACEGGPNNVVGEGVKGPMVPNMRKRIALHEREDYCG